MSTHTSKKCPHCGYVYERYTTYSKHLNNHSGCPIKTCFRCRNKFLDKDITEPAISPEPTKITVINCLFTMFFPFAVLSIIFAIPLFYETDIPSYYYLFVIIPAAIWICCAITSLCNRTKINNRILLEYNESVNRLKNPDYAIFLKDNGYYVPDTYLPKHFAKPKTISQSPSTTSATVTEHRTWICGNCKTENSMNYGQCKKCGKYKS